LAEYRYVSWPEYGNLAEALAEKVRSGGKRFDLVIGVARGGMPVAMVVSDHLDVRIDFINVKSYFGIGERGTPKILSTLTEAVGGKKVLIVDDLVDQGDTMKVVKEYLAKQKPRLVETAVLFKKPWTKTDPDYYLEVVDRWVVFPFELSEVNRLRVANGEATKGSESQGIRANGFSHTNV
jgi:hypoxanthine phosphoribosyltransferase